MPKGVYERAPKPPPTLAELEVRFWSKVDRHEHPGWAVTPELGPCWVWVGSLSEKGYGQFWLGPPERKHVRAHRFSYELAHGPIPDGLEPDHLCRRRSCVRPSHLEVVTHLENSRRSEPATRDHCLKGHPYTPENLYEGSGQRTCRACQRIFNRAYHQRKRAS